MHSSGIVSLAKGIGTNSDAVDGNELALAMSGIGLALVLASVQEAWMTVLEKDAAQYLKDTESISGDQGKAAAASADNLKKTQDSTQSDLETGNMNTLVEEVKAAVQSDGSVMGQYADLIESLIQSVNQLKNLINMLR